MGSKKEKEVDGNRVAYNKEGETVFDYAEKRTGNIHQRINRIMKEVDYVKKDKEIQFGNRAGYSVTGHDAVTKLIHPKLVLVLLRGLVLLIELLVPYLQLSREKPPPEKNL